MVRVRMWLLLVVYYLFGDHQQSVETLRITVEPLQFTFLVEPTIFVILSHPPQNKIISQSKGFFAMDSNFATTTSKHST